MSKWKKIALGVVLTLVMVIAPSLANGVAEALDNRSITIGTVLNATTADYTCDGVADNVQFQQALDALPAGGGELKVLAGTYSFASTVTRSISNVTIEGVGLNTIFNYNASSPIFTAYGTGWSFKDFATDAGGINVGATTKWSKINILEGSTWTAFASSTTSGVTGGDTHNHYGGDGAQIDHGDLGGLGDDDHTQYLRATETFGAPVYVAANNASTAEKTWAVITGGIVCDGTNDQTDLETAQTTAGSGGLVKLSSGTFAIGGSFTATATFSGVGRDTIFNLYPSYTITCGVYGDLEYLWVHALTGHATTAVRYQGAFQFMDLSKGRGLWVDHADVGSPPSGSIGIQLRAYTTDATASYIDTCHFWFDGARGAEVCLDILADGNASYTAYVNQNHIYGEWRQGKVACVRLTRQGAGDYEQADYNIFHMSLEAYNAVTVNGIVLDCASYNQFYLGTSDWDSVATGKLIKLSNSARWNAFVGQLNPAWEQLVEDNNSIKGAYYVHDEGRGREVQRIGAAADGDWSGTAIGGVAGATLAFGDLVYFQTADSRWELANFDNGTAGHNLMLGICVLAAASDGDITRILLQGFVRADSVFPTFTIGAPVYGSTTSGDVQTSAPSGSTDIVRKVGFGYTADILYFDPSNDFTTVT